MDEDSLWSHPTATNSIDFRDIAAGTHTLSIRSTNALGQWTDNVRTVTIVVEPTFFETWYGRMLLMIVVAGLIVLLTYIIIYVRTLEKRRKETLEAYLCCLTRRKRIIAIHRLSRNSTPNSVPSPLSLPRVCRPKTRHL